MTLKGCRLNCTPCGLSGSVCLQKRRRRLHRRLGLYLPPPTRLANALYDVQPAWESHLPTPSCLSKCGSYPWWLLCAHTQLQATACGAGQAILWDGVGCKDDSTRWHVVLCGSSDVVNAVVYCCPC